MDVALMVATVVVLAIPLIGTAVGAFKAIEEMRLNRRKREEEFRWKQAELAKKVLDETWEERSARKALCMLDWSGRVYDDSGRKTAPLTHEFIFDALGTLPRLYSPDQIFVRDTFDRLMEMASRTEHFIRIGLIHFQDVSAPWAYYVDRAACYAGPLRAFMVAYKYPLAQAFFERFEEWPKAMLNPDGLGSSADRARAAAGSAAG